MSDPSTIADEFVNYFTDHPKSIQNDILAPEDDYTDLIPLIKWLHVCFT